MSSKIIINTTILALIFLMIKKKLNIKRDAININEVLESFINKTFINDNKDKCNR